MTQNIVDYEKLIMIQWPNTDCACRITKYMPVFNLKIDQTLVIRNPFSDSAMAGILEG